MANIERRSIGVDLAAFKFEGRSAGMQSLGGYAAVYYDGTEGTQYRMGQIVERIMPGAFSRAMKEGQNIVCLFNHDSNMILGRRSAKTLRLADDDRGFRYTVDTPNTSYGRDLVEMVSRGDVKGSSFQFAVNGPAGESWRSEGDTMIRELRDLNMYDVSPVVSPAYTGTTLGLRHLAEWAESRQMSADDVKKLLDQTTVCDFSVDYEVPMEESPSDTMSGGMGMDMYRKRLALLEMEARI